MVPVGGGRPYLFSHPAVTSFIKRCNDQVSSVHVFCYVDHVDDIGCLSYPVQHGFVHADLSLTEIVPHISRQMVQKIARIHEIPLSSHWHLTKDELVKVFEGHDCINCNLYISVLEAQLPASDKKNKKSAKAFANITEEERVKQNMKKQKGFKGDETKVSTVSPVFPPPPLTKDLSETIIREWCKKSKPSSLEESGCAVCGELVPVVHLSRLKAVKTMLSILVAPGVT
ncbi:hypothetical protein L208DRAFT_1257340 [Tricholoma matsutake]|nr:hypothetical protein L208DRAFT_1257340 [Tricholoma matsutake 945]